LYNADCWVDVAGIVFESKKVLVRLGLLEENVEVMHSGGSFPSASVRRV
jgi:hypothetical protein